MTQSGRSEAGQTHNNLRLHTEIQNLDLRDIGWLTGNEQHNAEAVGEVGIAGEIASRFIVRRFAYAANIAEFCERLGIRNIFEQKFAGLIDIRVNLVSRDSLPCQSNSDIPADLTYPYRRTFVAHGREPQSHVIALVNAAPGFLQRSILCPSEHVQRADGRVSVLAP